jgi:hypothetical protein
MKQDGSEFPGVLQATSLYDEKKNLIGSNTVIFDVNDLSDKKIKDLEKYFRNAKNRLDEIKNTDYEKLDKNSKSEYDGLKKMFDMLLETDLKSLTE